jgi:hypothetical protein
MNNAAGSLHAKRLPRQRLRSNALTLSELPGADSLQVAGDAECRAASIRAFERSRWHSRLCISNAIHAPGIPDRRAGEPVMLALPGGVIDTDVASGLLKLRVEAVDSEGRASIEYSGLSETHLGHACRSKRLGRN